MVYHVNKFAKLYVVVVRKETRVKGCRIVPKVTHYANTISIVECDIALNLFSLLL